MISHVHDRKREDLINKKELEKLSEICGNSLVCQQTLDLRCREGTSGVVFETCYLYFNIQDGFAC